MDVYSEIAGVSPRSAPIVGVPRCRLRFTRRGDIVTALLTVPNAAPGVDLHFAARVDLKRVRARVSGAHVGALREAHNVSKTGWTFGQKRITTADANALQLYAAKGNTWLARYGNNGHPDVAAQRRIDQNRDRIVRDIYFAAQILDTLTKHERTWIRDKYHPHGFLHDVKAAATGPLGFVVNPAMALAYHTSHDKEFAGARALAASAALPGAGTSASALSKLAAASKVLKMARGVSSNPSVASMVPHLAPALDAAHGVLVAMQAAKQGDPRAKQALFYAARKAQQGNAAAQAGTRMAAKVYKLAVLPA